MLSSVLLLSLKKNLSLKGKKIPSLPVQLCTREPPKLSHCCVFYYIQGHEFVYIAWISYNITTTDK